MTTSVTRQDGLFKKMNLPHTLQPGTKVYQSEQERFETELYCKKPGWGWRHLQFLLMFFAIMGQFTHRACLAVGLVAMTKTIRPYDEVFSWGRKEQGYILGVFCWGYAVTHIPAGYLTTRFGAKRMMGGSLILSSLVTLLVPVTSYNLGWIGLTVVRFVLGLIQGSTFPATYTLLGKWAVPRERARSSALMSAATSSGNFAGMALSGFLAQQFGWPSIFYTFGVFTLVLSAIWLIFSSDSPGEHRWISRIEQNYIVQTIGEESKKTSGPIPWRAILTSSPFICALIAYCGFISTFWLLSTAIPRFISDMFDVSISINGVISSSPYVVMFVLSLTAGWLSDLLVGRKIASLGFTRKLFNTLGSWVPAAALIALSFTPKDYKLLQGLEIALAVGFLGCIFSGVMVNFVDLAPRYSGLTFAISNFVGSMLSGVVCLLAGLFVDEWGQKVGWAVSFCSAAVTISVFATVWIIGGTSKIQPWNDIQEKTTGKPNLESGVQNQSFRAD